MTGTEMTDTEDLGFSVQTRKDGAVAVQRHGRLVKTLKGRAATRLLDGLAGLDAAQTQLRLAQVTGQYRFGNERDGAQTRAGKRQG